MGGAFECLIGYLKEYTVWNHRGTKASSGLKHRIRDGVNTVMSIIKKLRNTVTKDSDPKDITSPLSIDAQSFITKLS